MFEIQVDSVMMKNLNPKLCIENHWPSMDMSDEQYDEYEDFMLQTHL